jgi:hypothetical protein
MLQHFRKINHRSDSLVSEASFQKPRFGSTPTISDQPNFERLYPTIVSERPQSPIYSADMIPDHIQNKAIPCKSDARAVQRTAMARARSHGP